MDRHDSDLMETQELAAPNAEYSIPVLLFASLKDAAGADHIQVQLPDNRVRVADFLTQCAQQHPVLAPWLPHVKVAVNCTYTNADEFLGPGDEVALLPPVAGG